MRKAKGPEVARLTGPAYWASYLINNDSSGIDSKEKYHADQWRERNHVESVVDCSAESRFTRHYDLYDPLADVTGGDVVDYICFLSPPVPVLFRVWNGKEGGDVIALFPAMPGDSSEHTCGSYQHVGQHGAADAGLVAKGTRLATPAEFADLKRELESAPYFYRLKVYTRTIPQFRAARRMELNRTRGVAL